MNITSELALASDVIVIPRSELPEDVRAELDDDGTFAVTRARGRSPSVLIDDATAQLLGEFREPSTIVDAVIRLGRRLHEDPDTVLVQSYPTLRRFLGGGQLVAAGSEAATPYAHALAVGERVAGGAVVRCVRVLDDTEIYQLALDCGGLAALKVLRDAPPDRSALRREADMLSLIDGSVSPRMLGEGELAGRPWLSMEWCDGVHVATAAAGLRRRPDADSELLDLCLHLVDAYRVLHELGIVHGDVHPGNALASPGGGVRLVDFGLARHVPSGHADVPPRGGVQAFLDPEYAAALRSKQAPPPASFSSDQFALGAVLYQLITGSNYLDFSITRQEMLRQIVEDRPLPFTRRDRAPWPDAEAVLGTSLAKAPQDRFAAMSMFVDRLAAVSPARRHGPIRPARRTSSHELVLQDMLANASHGGAWFEPGIPSAPYCSVAYGAAGLAVALYRVAVLRADPELLTLADEWVVRAARDADDEGAFTSDELQLDESRTGLVSPFHQRSGVHAVQALVSHAMGDTFARQHALAAFVTQSRQPCDNLDLTLGRSGTLLTAALLLEQIAGAPDADTNDLVELGNETMTGMWDELTALPAIRDGGPIAHLGVAHGWAGFLLATLRWCAIAGAERPAALETRLGQLAELGRPAGLGVRWTWIHHPDHAGATATMPGWCNGSAGFVHLWTTAHAVTGDDRWATLAERAAWDTYVATTKTAQLCCGLAGQAYALLEMYRHSGVPRWLAAASELGVRAAAGIGEASSQASPVRGSLHKGEVGIAVLAADLAEPAYAAMPFFGADLARRRVG